jgi:hypothetical protein
MGVAGDGKKGLEKSWAGAAEMAKSKTMSAKNAWGHASGYAESLVARGVDTARAQQLENWMNQQEVLAARREHRFMTDEFDKTKGDEDWRNLGKLGNQRNEDFDLDSAFGPVQAGDKIEGVIELSARVNQSKVYELNLLVSCNSIH